MTSLPDYERLQNDLIVIREAAGIEPHFGREDVWINLAVGPAGLFAFVWALFFQGRSANWGFLPVVVLAVVWCVWVRTRYRRQTGRSAVRRREYSASSILAVALAILMLGFVYWARHLGLSAIQTRAIAFFMIGLALLVVVVLDRRRWDSLPWAISMMLAGLAIPWARISAQAVIALAIAAAGPISAAVQARQLRRMVVNHAAH